MKLEDAIERLSAINVRTSGRDWKLVVKTLNPNAVGGTPCVDVTELYAGFDWNDGKILLETAAPLTRLSPEDVAAIHKSAKGGQSWHAFQSYKIQAERISALELELAQLKAKQGAQEGL